MHKALFWVAVAVLQLDEVNLYSAGTALLEQNLHTLDSMRVFNDKVAPRRLPWRGAPTAARAVTDLSRPPEPGGGVHGDQASPGVALQTDGSLCGSKLQRQLQLCTGGPPAQR